MKTHENGQFIVNLKKENSTLLCASRDRDSGNGGVLMDGDVHEVLTLLGMAACEVMGALTQEGVSKKQAIAGIWAAFSAGIKTHEDYDKEVQ